MARAQQAKARFRLEAVNHAPAFFDVDKLKWMNKEYLRALSVEDFVKRTSFAALTPNAFRRLAPALVRLARLEGLEGHARSAEIRCAEQES